MDKLSRLFGAGGMGGMQVGYNQSAPLFFPPSLLECILLLFIKLISCAFVSLYAQAPMGDQPMVDTAEVVHISSLALLKMLKHGRAGVPMEVMGLMLGMEY
jgi:hypothetical protein